MPWYPRNETPYYEGINLRVTYALGRFLAVNPLPETATHVGLIHEHDGDAVALTNFYRGRLQNYVDVNRSYYGAVIPGKRGANAR